MQQFNRVYCSCSLEECENRDVKSLYAKARRGEIKEFTGISAPYEIPEDPELIIDTENNSVDECVEMIIRYLDSIGTLRCDLNEPAEALNGILSYDK